MAGKSIDLTKVQMDPRSVIWLTIAFGVVVLAWAGGNWLANKAKGLTQRAGPVDEFA